MAYTLQNQLLHSFQPDDRNQFRTAVTAYRFPIADWEGTALQLIGLGGVAEIARYLSPRGHQVLAFWTDNITNSHTPFIPLQSVV